MNRSFLFTSGLLFVSAAASWAADADNVTLQRKTEIPGATLDAGPVRIELEDRLQDRAIIRVTNTSNGQHELLMAVPSSKLVVTPGQSLLFFPQSTNADQQSVQAWKCASCTVPLEFVYPKDQAVALTTSQGKPVMAVDPTYDKLPASLSPDDMKVVTLWLLTPKQITADGKGSGVALAKYADLKKDDNPPVATGAPVSPAVAAAASAPEPVSAPSASSQPATTQPAAPVHRSNLPLRAAAARPAMPHTAGDTGTYAAAGAFILACGALVALRRRPV